MKGEINTRLMKKKGSVSDSEMKRETGQSLPREVEKEEHHAVGCETGV